MLVVAGGNDDLYRRRREQTAAAVWRRASLFADQAHNLMAEPRWRAVADAIDVRLTDRARLE